MDDSAKFALVTGAGSGIGRATALALSASGWTVVASGRRIEMLEETAKLNPAPDRPILPLACDVRDPQSVAALFASVGQTFGRLDLLFNNAGTGAPPSPLEELSLEHWRRVVETNLTGVFLCIQEAMRMMKTQTPRGGRIINNGSISAHTPRPNSAPYTATKHAVSGLTKSVALDGRAFDIVCGQIDIGNAVTDMTASMARGMPQANGQVIPEPTMDVDHVAQAVVYMANLPLSANVLFMTVMASQMPFVGRG